MNNITKLARFSTSANATAPKTAIVMLNMGGPQHVDQVHNYLNRIMTDRDMIQLPFMQNKLGPWIAKRRTPDVQKKYQEIGGGSPILKWTNLQGKLMCERLDKLSPSTAPHKNYTLFRYVEPFVENAFDEIEKDGVKRVVLFSQYPQYSCATSGSSFNSVYNYLKDKSLTKNLELSVIDRWATHPMFVKTYADLIQKELLHFPEDIRKDVVILFSAHSLPLKAVKRGDPYPYEVGATVHQVMEQLNVPNHYQLVWQSKVGPLPWLEPFTDDAIKAYVKRHGKTNFVLVPIAFVNEHIETLHELDIEYCKELGAEVAADQIRRAPAANDHPSFIEALADIVTKHLAGSAKVGARFLARCPHCTNANCYNSKKWYGEVCKAK